MKFDLHVHSKYSKDSLLKPETILKVAKKKGLAGVAITDHNTIKGGLITQKMNVDENLTVIVGSEIKTEYGDIIGLFLQNEITSREFDGVVNEIKNQDGLVVLAHPFRNILNYPDSIFKKIDLIEIFNSRSHKKDVISSYYLVKKYKKPVTAGSDAHLFYEIGKAYLEVNSKKLINSNLKDEINENNSQVRGLTSNYYLAHGLSFLIENTKNWFEVTNVS